MRISPFKRCAPRASELLLFNKRPQALWSKIRITSSFSLACGLAGCFVWDGLGSAGLAWAHSHPTHSKLVRPMRLLSSPSRLAWAYGHGCHCEGQFQGSRAFRTSGHLWYGLRGQSKSHDQRRLRKPPFPHPHLSISLLWCTFP